MRSFAVTHLFELSVKCFAFHCSFTRATSNIKVSKWRCQLLSVHQPHIYATSHSIKHSAPSSPSQMFKTLKLALSKSVLHPISVRCAPANTAIIMISSPVLAMCAPLCGITISLTSSLLYPGFMESWSCVKIVWTLSSGQSWRMRCRWYARAPNLRIRYVRSGRTLESRT